MQLRPNGLDIVPWYRLQFSNNADLFIEMSRPKGRFALNNIEQGSSCCKQCHAKVIRDISECSQ